MRLLIIGNNYPGREIEQLFEEEEFNRCMDLITQDKDDHYGKRTMCNKKAITTIILPGDFFPLITRCWLDEREFTIMHLPNANFYDAIKESFAHLDVGDVIASFYGEKSDHSGAVQIAAKSIRKKLHEFTWNQKCGWHLVDRKKPLITRELFR